MLFPDGGAYPETFSHWSVGIQELLWEGWAWFGSREAVRCWTEPRRPDTRASSWVNTDAQQVALLLSVCRSVPDTRPAAEYTVRLLEQAALAQQSPNRREPLEARSDPFTPLPSEQV